MRSIWKGAISFGLVSIPIQLYGATENHSVSFHQIHTKDGCGGRIRYRKVCETEGVEVPSDEIGKGFSDDAGDTVLLTDADLASLPLPTARTIEILTFIPASDIDPIQLDRAYYLGAETAAAAKPYVLLREALEHTGKAAVARFALRGRESLGLLRVVEGTLVLHSMLWPDEVRAADGLAPSPDVTVREAELGLAETLMDSLGDLDWTDLHDEYRHAVEELVAAKLEGRTPEEQPAQPTGGRVIDLMAALENSVAAARQAREGDRGGATIHPITAQGRASQSKKAAGGESGDEAEESAPAKKSTAKKAPAKKAVSKQAPAKKTAAKKAAAKKSATEKPVAKKAASKQAAGGSRTSAKDGSKSTASRQPAKKTGKAAAKTTTRETAAKKTTASRGTAGRRKAS
ncbi:Ku protein [Streptomyces sp. 549]|uniref:non-homologous end joining protein Ku n=1 Tax=Streptomyces sp. 549 TaxID=3049076 RepID=UPI0024C301B4|nr:Ku protein [Streptomyces sp. 549]MDK1476059.1 Ku protein [Streptomyces sp. 549]